MQAWAKVLLPVVSTQYINVDGAAAYLMDHGIEVYAGRDDDTLRKACVLAQTWKKERNKVVRGNREHKALEKKDPYYKILSGKFGRDFQINAGPKYDGTVFTGCNVENAAYGSTICAERTALLKAVSEGHRDDWQAMAIAGRGEDYCWPCGSCRQMLYEFAPDLTVLVARGNRTFVSLPLSELLSRLVRRYGRG